MRKRKKVLAALLTGCMMAGLLSGCMEQGTGGGSSNSSKEAVEIPEGLWDPY